jgi:tetratricopeptide (TPR) repeat protein
MRSLLPRTLFVTALLASAAPLLALDPPPEKERWTRVDLDQNITIFSNARDGVTRTAEENIEQMRRVIVKVTQLDIHSPIPTYIYVFRDEQSFAPYRDGILGENPYIVGGFVGRTATNYILIGDIKGGGVIDKTVYHELTHYLLRNTVAWLPSWLDEGLAEFYGSFTPVADSVRIGVPDHGHIDLLTEMGLMPLRDFFAFHPLGHGVNDLRTHQFYAQSWLFAHYLLIGKPARGAKLGDFLSRLDQNQTPEIAFPAAFGLPMTDVEHELSSYLRQTRLNLMQYSRRDLGTITIADPKPMSRAATLAALGELALQRKDEEEAQPLLEAALKLEPENAHALTALGLLHKDYGRNEESDKAFARATAAATPSEYRPHALAATVLAARLQRRARDGEVIAPADIAAARRLATVALERAPWNADVLATLGGTYTFAGEDPKPGLQWSRKALELMPSRIDVAADLVLLYARSSKPALAGLRHHRPARRHRALRHRGTGESRPRRLHGRHRGAAGREAGDRDPAARTGSQSHVESEAEERDRSEAGAVATD